jgi:hypothetical protein
MAVQTGNEACAGRGDEPAENATNIKRPSSATVRLPYLQGMPLSLKSLFRRRWEGLRSLQRKHACRQGSGLQLAVRASTSMLCR